MDNTSSIQNDNITVHSFKKNDQMNFPKGNEGELSSSHQNEMHSFKELSSAFEKRFSDSHFPKEPKNLYDAAQYLLTLGGKRIRPVMCLMGNEMFDKINENAYHV